MKKFNLIVMALLCAYVTVAAEVTLNKSAKFTVLTDYMPLDNTQSYFLKVDVSGVSGYVDIMIDQYSSSQRRIAPHQVNAVANTQTELVADAVKGEKSFLVKDASMWNPSKQGKLVAFNAKEDFSDLPNSALEYYITSVKQENGSWRVTLNRPLSKTYAAKTGIRLHADCNYLIIRLQLPLAKPYTGRINAAPKFGAKYSTLWPGTGFFRIMVRSASDEAVAVKSISLEQRTGKK